MRVYPVRATQYRTANRVIARRDPAARKLETSALQAARSPSDRDLPPFSVHGPDRADPEHRQEEQDHGGRERRLSLRPWHARFLLPLAAGPRSTDPALSGVGGPRAKRVRAAERPEPRATSETQHASVPEPSVAAPASPPACKLVSPHNPLHSSQCWCSDLLLPFPSNHSLCSSLQGRSVISAESRRTRPSSTLAA